ncbi:metal ABC transporter permease [Brackiella oedipodis]|uniref:metal ABC transporter permease n=1 Tax=Brackiella oedipodis TaxID=124225 RepID=UPI00048DE111|nr:metal ABC transporter permease [Brackiella oedipodis]
MSFLQEFFVLPLELDFMRQALFVAVLTAAVCSVLSCFLVLKGWSLMGDAISHAVLPGIVLAFVWQLPLALGAFVAGLLCASLSGFLTQQSRLKQDTAMGIVFSGMFAVGIVLFVRIKTNQHLGHILFGNLLGIPKAELLQSIVLSLVVLAVLVLKWKDFMLFCFDVSHARVCGLSVRFLHYALLTLLSLTIVSAMQAVGVILVVALLIAPGACAYMLCKRFAPMLWTALLISVSSAVLGVFLSFYLDADTGPMIVVVHALVFLLIMLGKAFKNLFTKKQTVALPAVHKT